MKTDVLNSISGHLIDARWALWALDWPQERDLAQTLLFTSAEPLLVQRLSLTYQHPAKLDCSGRGATIPSLSWLLQPPWLDHKPFYHWSATATITLQENDPLTHNREPHQAWAGSGQWRLVVGGHSSGVEAGLGLLTLGCDPGLLPSHGVRPGACKTEGSCSDQGMSSYSAWVNQELCPAQHWPPGAEQVSQARLLLLATDQRVKAAALIREGILLWRYVWKVPISWN